MRMRGHTLVWHTQAPEWFFREGYEENEPYVDKETMLMRMESYIAQLMTHVQDEYPGVVYCWDVVNEAVDPDRGIRTAISCAARRTTEHPTPGMKPSARTMWRWLSHMPGSMPRKT